MEVSSRGHPWGGCAVGRVGVGGVSGWVFDRCGLEHDGTKSMLPKDTACVCLTLARSSSHRLRGGGRERGHVCTIRRLVCVGFEKLYRVVHERVVRVGF